MKLKHQIKQRLCETDGDEYGPYKVPCSKEGTESKTNAMRRAFVHRTKK